MQQNWQLHCHLFEGQVEQTAKLLAGPVAAGQIILCWPRGPEELPHLEN